ncbi:MAG: hypothetical protein IPH97_16640 [Ignavibacteriales bacterium]|nr:hypothetical protein [Ignavibacteriales bacterium]
MKLKYFLFLCLSFLIFNSSLLIGTVRYVSKTGTSQPPYTSWQTAADSIQKCINICSFGDTVYVANGVYKEQVVMIRGLALIGSGPDSCIIDTRSFNSDLIVVTVLDSCIFKNFRVTVSNYHPSSSWGFGITIYDIGQGLCTIIENNIIENTTRLELFLQQNNSLIQNNINQEIQMEV